MAAEVVLEISRFALICCCIAWANLRRIVVLFCDCFSEQSWMALPPWWGMTTPVDSAVCLVCEHLDPTLTLLLPMLFDSPRTASMEDAGVYDLSNSHRRTRTRQHRSRYAHLAIAGRLKAGRRPPQWYGWLHAVHALVPAGRRWIWARG